jgi:hypothetical protein
MAHSWQASFLHALCCSWPMSPYACCSSNIQQPDKTPKLGGLCDRHSECEWMYVQPKVRPKDSHEAQSEYSSPDGLVECPSPTSLCEARTSSVVHARFGTHRCHGLALKTPTGTPRRSEAVKSVWLPSPAATHTMGKHTAAPCHISLLAPVPAITQAATTCCIAPWTLARPHLGYPAKRALHAMHNVCCGSASWVRRALALFSLMSTPG